jgi:hypothetical protein
MADSTEHPIPDETPPTEEPSAAGKLNTLLGRLGREGPDLSAYLAQARQRQPDLGELLAAVATPAIHDELHDLRAAESTDSAE